MGARGRKPREARRWPFGVVFVGSFILIVGCFSASTFYVDFRMRQIAVSYREVSDNALPSVVHLSAMRSMIAEIWLALQEEQVAGAHISVVDALDRSLGDEVAAYAALPKSPDELTMSVEMLAHTHAARDAVIALHEQPRPIGGAAARVALEEARRDVGRADASIGRLMDYNAEQARTFAARLDVDRRALTNTAFVLDAASVAVSLALVLLALRATRRAARLQEERAGELEIFAHRLAHDVRGPIMPAMAALVTAEANVTEPVVLELLRRGQSSLRTYLYAIARNELFAYLRKRQRHRNDLDFAELSLEALGTSPSSYVARGEAQKLLLHALRTLPLEQQLLLELHYWEDMDSTELAEVMALGEGAVRTRLSRARKTLRERMDAMVDSPLPAHASDDDLDAWARRMRAQGRPAK